MKMNLIHERDYTNKIPPSVIFQERQSLPLGSSDSADTMDIVLLLIWQGDVNHWRKKIRVVRTDGRGWTCIDQIQQTIRL